LFGWKKNTVIKYSPGYVGGRFVSFLEIHIHAPWPTFHNNIFVLRLLVAVVVISHCHSLQRQQEKTMKAYNAYSAREKKHKGGPSSDVYMLRYHVRKT
jgi:hypothetical protein